MIKFAHIAPANYTGLGIYESDMNMVLAHIAESSDKYAAQFKDSDKETLLDNGAFELGVPYEAERMIGIGHKVGADIMVLPDYPKEDWLKGWDKVDADIRAYREAGFKTMFVPQSLAGDELGYLKSLDRAIRNKDIDLIGLSILGCPNAFPSIPTVKVREKILERIAGLEGTAKRFHILGMLNYPLDEIVRLAFYEDMINSWDTSAAIWAGIHGNILDFGKEKFAKSVDFNYPVKDFDVGLVLTNIQRMRNARGD